MQSGNEAFAEERADDIDRVVRGLPRGPADMPIYWFEMRSILGWEKMMLVLNYANNRAVCDHLKSIAYKESPGREFRCTAAN